MTAFIRRFVHYGITPIFLIMAVINFMIERGGAGHHQSVKPEHKMDMPDMNMSGMDMASMEGIHHGTSFIETLGSFGLGSMWIMYLLMAIAHISPYLPKADK